MLVRDYLKKILYDSQKGYFIKSSPIMMNDGKQVTDFTKLSGRNEWIKVQSELFKSKQGSGEWLTQCELFAPHFSSVLVDYVCKNDVNAKQGLGLNIFEVGGGSGTNALHFLDALKLRYPNIYSQSKYTLCEISPTMADLQLRRVSGRHSSVCKVKNVDFLEWNTLVEEPSVIIAMEVLDNLPHDKIMYTKSGVLPFFQEEDLEHWREIVVENWGVEGSRPLSDPIVIEATKRFWTDTTDSSAELTSSAWSLKTLNDDIKKYLAVFARKQAEKNANAVFVPSGSVKLLKTVQEMFPKHTLILGDFSYLPFGDVSRTSKNLRFPGSLYGCKNAPIVSGNDSKTNQRSDFPSYILHGQNVDVFFPTDFARLAAAYRAIVTGGSCEVMTTHQFLDKNIRDEDRELTTTKSGFSPMLEDFENVSFLLARKD